MLKVGVTQDFEGCDASFAWHLPSGVICRALLHRRHIVGIPHLCDKGRGSAIQRKEDIKRIAYPALQVFAKQIVRAVDSGQAQHSDENAQDHQDGTPFAPCHVGNGFAIHYTDKLHSSPSSSASVSASGPVMMACTPSLFMILPSSRSMRALARSASSGAYVT